MPPKKQRFFYSLVVNMYTNYIFACVLEHACGHLGARGKKHIFMITVIFQEMSATTHEKSKDFLMLLCVFTFLHICMYTLSRDSACVPPPVRQQIICSLDVFFCADDCRHRHTTKDTRGVFSTKPATICVEPAKAGGFSDRFEMVGFRHCWYKHLCRQDVWPSLVLEVFWVSSHVLNARQGAKGFTPHDLWYWDGSLLTIPRIHDALFMKLIGRSSTSNKHFWRICQTCPTRNRFVRKSPEFTMHVSPEIALNVNQWKYSFNRCCVWLQYPRNIKKMCWILTSYKLVASQTDIIKRFIRGSL